MAINEKNLILATSARKRTIQWPTYFVDNISDEIKSQMKSEIIKTGIVFGREDNGLSNEELQKCHYHLIIPASEEYSSLNLSHALQIAPLKYERSFLMMKLIR